MKDDFQKSALTIKSLAQRHLRRRAKCSLSILLKSSCEMCGQWKINGTWERDKNRRGCQRVGETKTEKTGGPQLWSPAMHSGCLPFGGGCWVVYLIDILISILKCLIYLTYSTKNLWIYLTFELFSRTWVLKSKAWCFVIFMPVLWLTSASKLEHSFRQPLLVSFLKPMKIHYFGSGP